MARGGDSIGRGGKKGSKKRNMDGLYLAQKSAQKGAITNRLREMKR